MDVASLSGADREDRKNRSWRMVDGSGWFYVRPEREGACGVFTENRSFRDGPSCLKWIRERGQSPPDVVAFGASIGGDEAARWREALRPAAGFDYLGDYGYCGSAAACGIGMFVKNFRGRTLLHINRDPRGSYALLEVEVF